MNGRTTTPCYHAARPPHVRAAIEHSEALLAQAKRSDDRRRGDAQRIADSYHDATVACIAESARIMRKRPVGRVG